MSERALVARADEDWTDLENEAVVAAYLDMLQRELRGERYSKTELLRQFEPILPARTHGSIQRKLQNVSAVREELGLDWIDGYKPLPHYQHSLKDAVVAADVRAHRIADELSAYGSSALVAAQTRRLATDDVLVAAPGTSGRRARQRTSVSLTGSALGALHDFQRRDLGRAGEAWVLDLERERLARAGRPDLARRVEWTADERGDGAGYDITSFRTDGHAHQIEVKTTNRGPLTPFYVTRWEIEVSRELADTYSLYRVHGFARDPRIYVLDGSVEERARLEPKVFLGIPF